MLSVLHHAFKDNISKFIKKLKISGNCYIKIGSNNETLKTTIIIYTCIYIFIFSIQQLVDCSVNTGNLGCSGGSLRNTLKYIHSVGGLMLDEEYSYSGKVFRIIVSVIVLQIKYMIINLTVQLTPYSTLLSR